MRALDIARFFRAECNAPSSKLSQKGRIITARRKRPAYDQIIDKNHFSFKKFIFFYQIGYFTLILTIFWLGINSRIPPQMPLGPGGTQRSIKNLKKYKLHYDSA